MLSSTLKPGDKAPDFTLPDQEGRPVRVSDLWRKGPVVLYFYPRDETPGCTAQACSFRDKYQDFQDAGAQVVGVSDDPVDKHAGFARHHRLPFTLLADPDEAVHRQYGLDKLLGFLRARVTFVIDSKGVIQLVFDDRLRALRHVDAALETVRGLARAG